MIGPKSISPVGATWAFCHVSEADELIGMECGYIMAHALGVDAISSPLAELYAGIRGLWPLPEGWDGTYYCDNESAIGRIFWNWACNGVPEFMIQQTRVLRARLPVKPPVLLGGHPSRADLERGTRAKDGKPVSKWNVLCDKKCRQLSEQYESLKTGKAPTWLK